MVHTFKNPDLAAKAFTEFLIKDINEVLNQGKIYTIALSGGNTPKLVFNELASSYNNKTDWSKVHFFWGDERMVSVSDKESNYGTAKRLFFDKTDIPKVNIHPIIGENNELTESARYSEEILNYVPEIDGWPRFDMVLLGLGEDGHTASIFPNQQELLYSPNVCEVAIHPKSGQKRITISGKVINNAIKIVFLITGSSKALVLKEILNRTEKSRLYPASSITPAKGETIFFLDESASGR